MLGFMVCRLQKRRREQETDSGCLPFNSKGLIITQKVSEINHKNLIDVNYVEISNIFRNLINSQKSYIFIYKLV